MDVLLIGFAAGILSGLLGVGGGTIIIPALVIILSIPQHVAQGVALAVFVPTAAAGAYSYFRRGNLNIKLGMPMAGGAWIGVVFGAILVAYIGDAYLKKLFGVFMIIIAGMLLKKKR